MKKRVAVILAFLCVFCLGACNSTVNQAEKSEEEKNALLRENKSMAEQITRMEQAAQTQLLSSKQTVKISGGFEASVRHIIPGYIEDGTTLHAAVVTMFQSTPQVVYLGPELIDQVEEGKNYFFTIRDKEINLAAYSGQPEQLVASLFHDGMTLSITDVSPCEPMGLDGDQLQFAIE